ncbi:MAG: tRNA (adenosine(37)-N6)-threonylcarbamoyltransferase complex ATPase subunit type 1 TsaE, partial [Saezia sp.]
HLLQALDIKNHIKSPTYAIVEPYETPAFLIWHFDFYRFNDPLEWEDAGFREIFAAPGLKLVEWPEQAGDLLPTADLEFFITRADHEESRKLQIQTNTPLGHSIVNVFN